MYVIESSSNRAQSSELLTSVDHERLLYKIDPPAAAAKENDQAD